MAANRSIRQRLLTSLLGYLLLSSIAVIIFGFVVNERAEQALWQALLEGQFDQLQDRLHDGSGYQWSDTETLQLLGSDAGRPLPQSLANAAPGVHDEIIVEGRQSVALLRVIDGSKWALVLDITELERQEAFLALSVLASMLAMIVFLGFGFAWGVDRLIRPLGTLAQQIVNLRPDRSGGRIALSGSASTELVFIADALNDYLQRNAQFVRREHEFIDTASHELRTPISVIAGAAELASAQPDMRLARMQLSRIVRTASEMERLIALLLVLARDPSRLAKSSDRISLDLLLPEIVEDYRAMAQQHGLTITLASTLPCEIMAPLPVVQAAIGNLLRNAIENSDSGEIAIHLTTDAVVEIRDPGHGMSPEEISVIYARMSRGESREGTGIGLQLISRLCEHLGWLLSLEPSATQGTTARLALRSLPRQSAG